MQESKRLAWLDVRWDAVTVFSIAFGILVGGYIRLAHVLASDFPLNDGGMFFSMTQDLIRNNFALPMYASYNSLGIPFAYPPLPFYMAGFLSVAFGIPLLEVIRLFPAIVSILTIPVVYKLSYDILQSSFEAIVASVAFALLPRSFEWMIMGGGLTRAPGFLFALLTLSQVYLLYTQKRIQYVVLTILFASLLILSHPELTWFAVYSVAVFFLFFGRQRKGICTSLIVAIGVVLATSPWWITIAARGQLSSLLTASQSGSDVWYGNSILLLVFDFAEEPFLRLCGVLGLLGLFVCFAERKFFLPTWIAAMFLLEPRSAATYATVPLAMLAAVCIHRIILPGFAQLNKRDNHMLSDANPRQTKDDLNSTLTNYGRLPGLMLVFFLVYAMFSAWMFPFTPRSPVRVISDDERQAEQWVAGHTPEDSKFLVITADSAWQDSTSEWFPVLAQRTSLATVQGYEWFPDRFFVQLKQYNRLQKCAFGDLVCLERWAKDTDVLFTHVYVSKDTAKLGQSSNALTVLEDSLRVSRDYVLIYDGQGASVFARKIADKVQH